MGVIMKNDINYSGGGGDSVIYPTTETKIGTYRGQDLYRQMFEIQTTDWARGAATDQYYTALQITGIQPVAFDLAWEVPSGGSISHGFYKYPCEVVYNLCLQPDVSYTYLIAKITHTDRIGTSQMLTLDYIKTS